MTAIAAKWGNSLGLRIPKEIASSLKIKAGDALEINLVDDAIIVKPSPKATKSERPNLDELLAGFSKESETDWGIAQGDEIW